MKYLQIRVSYYNAAQVESVRLKHALLEYNNGNSDFHKNICGA
jgi:hypothetical protein